ncbi:MAG: hypothetical protein IAE95_12395 [Chitinophagaceae bacterium]|nr:hypothetical protein [Chitinophagaceae bacterium]
MGSKCAVFLPAGGLGHSRAQTKIIDYQPIKTKHHQKHPPQQRETKNDTKSAQLQVVDHFGAVDRSGDILKSYPLGSCFLALPKYGANDALLFTHNVLKDTTGTKIFINSHKFEK